MSAEHITPMKESQLFLPAWAISLTLHGMLVGLAFAFSTQIKPLVDEALFTWDVSLVQQINPDSKSESVESKVTSAQPPVKKLHPSRTKSVPEPPPPVMPMEQKIETLRPRIEQKAEIPQVREEPAEQQIPQLAETRAEATAEVKESVAVAPSLEPVESQPFQQDATAITSAPAEALPLESPANVAAAPGHETKADNRWLAESLWRRVAELKHYPNSARMNGQEGKVILKAVIRSDGQLADVFVQKSSGYSALDAAAIEAVKLACPLEMKHAIGKPQIVVSLPIVYSLAN
ncbi:MAG: energy transducer TonB [Nitrospira sp.]